jgi:Nucleotidyl transferase of unknown function (DUF2204)
MSSIDLNDPIAVLLIVLQALESAGIEAAAYGGLALAVYGEPRETKDADFAVAGVSGAQAAPALQAAGLDVVLAFDHVPFGGQLVSRLTLIGGAAGSLNTADLVEPRSQRYAREVLARSLTGSLREQSVRVVSPEDFVVLKVLATRDRDLEDAATIIRSLSSRIDMELIVRELEALAIEISDHDIKGRWRRIKQM